MSKKLLLADDSITIQKVIGITFAQEDYALTVVDNGEAALASARGERPDLILADVFMPGRNGYELCAAIKQDPQLQQVPVLLLTGTFEPFDEGKARAAGADSWIAKPFESQALINRVEELLSRPVAPAPPAAAEAPAAAVSAPPPADIWAELAEIDEAADPAPAIEEDFWTVPAAADDETWGSVPEAGLYGGADWGGAAPAEEDAAAAAEGDSEMEFDAGGFFENEESVHFGAPAEEMPAALEDEAADWQEADNLTTEWAGFEEDILPLDDADIIAEEDLEEIPEPRGFHATDFEPPAADDLTRSSAPIADEFTFEETAAGDGAGSEFAFPGPGSGESPADEFLFEDETPAADEELPPAADPVWGMAAGEETPAPVIEPPAEPAPQPVATAAGAVPAAAVEAKIAALSDEDIARIVEKVAAPVIERLAQAMLEKMAWEVVPDLAESLIREEIRKIRERAAG